MDGLVSVAEDGLLRKDNCISLLISWKENNRKLITMTRNSCLNYHRKNSGTLLTIERELYQQYWKTSTICRRYVETLKINESVHECA